MKTMNMDNNERFDKLEIMIKSGFAAVDDLSMMVKNGFDHVGEEINELKEDVGVLKVDVKDIKENRIKRFEFDGLERRVEDTEFKLKAAN